ncbi:type II toxin-antitoxin system HicB family antitoxin [Deinococcus planocerae]|uniref:type II toxin-antitoxin system HicB family antitoxin n=1 Tax=Deinococcus planocerae TaxID=1737569 RepID=UPI000C7F5302|nr:type II toxin-antitoxin system HicB family antitoxin [Deinococcus planocerae]
MEYTGYIATASFDDEADLFHGEVVNLRDVITFQGRTVDELRQAFKESVDDDLAFCRERGEEPEKPFSGRFNLRIRPELHARLAARARSEGLSLNAFVKRALERTT